MTPSTHLCELLSVDALVAVEIGLLSAAAEERASIARTPVSRASWLLAAVEIADLGGVGLFNAPASLVSPLTAIGRAWATSAERQKEYRARPAPQAEPMAPWEGDFPIEDICNLTEDDLLQIAAEHLPRAEDMCDGSNASDTVQIDFAQDQVEQAVVELVRRGWQYDDSRLDAYRPFASAAAPVKPWEPTIPDPAHLALMARKFYRKAQYITIGEDWLDGVMPADAEVAGDARLILAVDFDEPILLADIEGEFREVQEATCGEFHFGYISTTVMSDPACCIRDARVMLSFNFSGEQRKTVLAFLQRSNIRRWRAHIEHRWLFENEHWMGAFIALDCDIHSTKGRNIAEPFRTMGSSRSSHGICQHLEYHSPAAQERASTLEKIDLYRDLAL